MIRDIEKSDLANIAKMHEENFIDHWSFDMLSESFSQKTFVGGVEILENEIACTVMFSRIFDEAELLSIVTKKDFRQKGLAENLLNTYIGKLAESEVKKIFLEVRESNLSAINLYSKLGFNKFYERKKYYGEETAIIMVKEL